MTTGWDKEEARRNELKRQLEGNPKVKVTMTRNRLLFTYGAWGIIGFLLGFVVFSP